MDPILVIFSLLAFFLVAKLAISTFQAIIESLQNTLAPALIIAATLIGLSILFNGCS